MMQFWVGLVAGVLIGWVIELVIDWCFWRQESFASLLNSTPLRQQLSEAQREIDELRAQLTRAQLAVAEPSVDTTAVTRNALAHITGIGQVYERRLNEAGIYTFAQLAQTSAERLQEIIQPEEWQAADFEGWIQQAQMLTQESLASVDAPDSKGA